MQEKIFEKDINTDEDTLLVQRDISVYLECDNYYSTHRVSEYKIKNGKFRGEKYYIFDYIDGKSIMNYKPKHYNELLKHITIYEDEPIFMRMKYLDGDTNLYQVSLSYREND